MATSLLSAVLCLALTGAREIAPPAASPFERRQELVSGGKIDELAFGRLNQLGIRPARPCSDQVFVRRVYLDVIGTLPTPEEVRKFLADGSPNKRGVLIDRLLEREEFADYWAMKWGDVLRVKAEFPINLWPNAAQAYHHWIRACIRQNMPYDRFVRELLTANGSNFRVPQVNFYRAMQNREPQGIAQTVALSFMGCRADKWPKERLAGMAAFFSQVGYKRTGEWKEEVVFFDPALSLGSKASEGTAKASVEKVVPVFPDGTPAKFSPGDDPRVVFADWLITPKNPWFARSAVNRVWSWLVGRGIVHEPDDIRPDNPPSNPELLAWLEDEFVAHHYDLKHVYRLILNSKTYQRSSIPRSSAPLAEAHFASYPLRRLEAEVLIDALNQITGTKEKYSSPIPEPFTFIPEECRSIALPDGSIGSSFLEMFGRPPRDNGLESERNNRLTAGQRLHLVNSSHIQRKIEQGPKIVAIIQSGKKQREIVEELYLRILSRRPTEEEVKIAAAYAKSAGLKPREAIVDLAWALINSSEFLYRH
jgi:hypothetical protein